MTNYELEYQLRPVALPVDVSAIPVSLISGKRFCCWRYKLRDKRWTKPPYQPNGKLAKSNDPATWSGFDDAWNAFEKGGYDGIGRFLHPDDGIAGFDLDHCRSEEGTITTDAQAIVDALASYTEISPSGRGLRLFVFGRLPGPRRRNGSFEVYDGTNSDGALGGRYLTLTGTHFAGTPSDVIHRQQELDAVYKRFIDPAWSLNQSPHNTRSGRPHGSQSGLHALTENPKAAAILSGRGNGYRSASEADLALVRFGDKAGLSDQEIEASLLKRRVASGDNSSKLHRRDYVTRTISKVRMTSVDASQFGATPAARNAISVASIHAQSHDSPRLSRTAREVFEAMAGWSLNGTMYSAGRELIARHIPCSKRTVSYAWTELEQVGCIKRDSRSAPGRPVRWLMRFHERH